MKNITKSVRTFSRNKSLTRFLPLFAAFFLGIISSSLVYIAVARAADSTILTACVTRLAGVPRFVSDASKCTKSETVVTWNQQGPMGPAGPQGPAGTGGSNGTNGYDGLPFMCYNCDLKYIAEKLPGHNFSDSVIINSFMRNVDAHGANFTNASLNNSQLNDTNFSNSNFTNAKLRLTILNNSNFTGANFTGADLTNASGLSSATVTGVTWNNTICPDQTNSNDNANTCLGHF